jgi:DNA-binding NtrC family response regulator
MNNLNARILIVDDEPMLRRTMSDRMKFWDCTTEEASTGEEALEMLGCKSYDLVLLDIKMPGISGLEVLATMRERNDLTDVVVLTAHASVEAAVEAIQGGATDFLLGSAHLFVGHIGFMENSPAI